MPLGILRLAAFAAVVASAPAARAAAAPWDGPPLSADPSALRAAAERLPPPAGAAMDVLLEEGSFAFAADGSAVHVHRVVFRPLTPDAARAAARVERAWAPWHQARPEIRARVVGERDVHTLDPSALSDAPAIETRGGASERRVLSATLPGVRPGAIVEEVVVVRDEKPLFAAGAVYRFRFGGASPARLVRLRLEAPAALPLRFALRGMDAAPEERVEGGVRRITFVRRDVAAALPLDPAPPRELPFAPHVAFGWGRSWADVAERFGAACDDAARGAELRAEIRAAVGERPRAGRDELVRRAVAWLHGNVRHDGLPFGESSPIPDRPRDTLERGSGGTADLALLLVALLREAGLDARVALLSREWHDVPADLPGLGLFDHALVRVEGRPALWVDATDPHVAPGVLPPLAQGRLALVAGGGTKGLVRIPMSRPDDNVAVTVREIHLAELGPARVVETRELTGALAAPERAFRARAPEAHRSGLDERYAREVFRAATFLGAEVEGLADPSKPLRVRVEADGSTVVETRDDDATVPATADVLFAMLPGALGEDGEPRARRHDLELPFPFRAELRYRVFPPVGFRARPLPGDATERFGPATLSQRFAVERDGSVTATLRLDTGASRIGAADADRLLRRARGLASAGARIELERTGAALLGAGKVAEALAEMRRVAALHPREAMHALHLSVALVGAGFAVPAAEEARRAERLEPGRAWAARVLGWVLEHDEVGRLHGPGYDRDGAIAAYRRARELDPSHAGGRAALAELLATNAAGVRHGPGADLAAAVSEYRLLREETGSRDHDLGLLAALFAAGRYAEAASLARELAPSPERNVVLVAATAAGAGPSRAEEEAGRLGEHRRDALRDAAVLLARARRHPAAAALARAAAAGAPNEAELAALAGVLASLRPWQDVAKEGDEASRLVKALLVAAVTGRESGAVAPEVASRVPAGPARERLLEGVALPFGAARRTLQASGMTPDLLLDLLLSHLELAREGDPASGLRLRARFRFAPGERAATAYAVREKNGLRLVATDSAWPLLGAEAERLAAAGDVAGARRWLAWAREGVPGDAGDPATPAGVLAALARPGAKDASPRVAAAALLAFADTGGATLPLLREARAAAGEPFARRALAHALAQAARAANRPEEALAAAEDVLAQDPTSRDGFAAKAWALGRLRRTAEIDRAAEDILAYRPEDPEVLSLLGSSRLLGGDLAGASRAWQRLVEAGRATPLVYNNAAWVTLFLGTTGETALEWARRAADGGEPGDHAARNTLAALLAELDRPGEARELFLRSLEGGRPLAPSDWYVFGRIAERWGEAAVARAAYGRVEPEHVAGAPDPSSAHELARRRLAALAAAR